MTRIGYARVSSSDQNLARQIDILKKYKVDDEYIFREKVSGATIVERKELQNMLKFIRKGDIVVVASLDRLGRNAKDVGFIIQKIKDKGAMLIAPELPDFSAIPDPSLRNMFTEMMLAVFKWQAQAERDKIRERQREGIEIAKKNGVYKGRKPKYSATTNNAKNRLIWETVIRMLNDKEQHHSVTEIAKRVGISRQQIYRIRKRG